MIENDYYFLYYNNLENKLNNVCIYNILFNDI